LNILGISAFYHDAAAALVCNGEIIAAAQEERFTRKKNDASFPHHAIAYCLEESGLNVSDLDAVVFYEKPFLKLERLLESYYAYAPSGLISFLKSMPVWISEKAFMKKKIKDGLEAFGKIDRKKTKFLFPEHHLSHAASAFFCSPFEESAIITIDGVGEWATSTISHAKGNDITILKQGNFPHSLGLLYSAFTYFLGFKVNSGEYKLMGLAPYGNEHSEFYKKSLEKIKTRLVKIYPDGSIWLDQKYFNYATGLRMINERKWFEMFDVFVRKPEDEMTQEHCDLALAIQRVTEEVVMNMAMEAKRLTGSKNVCMAGGVALNCVANGKLANKNVFENIFIQPAAGDAGGALGAALAAQHIYYGQKRTVFKDILKGSFLGPEYDLKAIRKMAMKYKAVYTEYKDSGSLASNVATLLADGKIVGFFQGRMEFGPRALGGRSILADPRNPEIQKQLNIKTKFRESFRPFAPAILAEDAGLYFDIDHESPYMLFVHQLKEEYRLPLPDSYKNFDWKDKLSTPNSQFPAITHVDFSARVQTVDKQANPRFWELINAFKSLTGCSMVVNTSMNVRGEPMVCSPEDAYLCFMKSGMDYLVCENILFEKSLQPEIPSLRIDANDTAFAD
jgi:carbamoyltransferase